MNDALLTYEEYAYFEGISYRTVTTRVHYGRLNTITTSLRGRNGRRLKRIHVSCLSPKALERYRQVDGQQSPKTPRAPSLVPGSAMLTASVEKLCAECNLPVPTLGKAQVLALGDDIVTTIQWMIRHHLEGLEE